jgi:hypothetical protein
VPLEECDNGENNSYLPDACRPNCLLPYCGDGVQDSAEFCDDGEANAVDGDCLPDCTRPCPELALVTGVTISLSVELLPSSIAVYTCDESGTPPADGDSVRTCLPNGTWTGASPTACCMTPAMIVRHFDHDATALGLESRQITDGQITSNDQGKKLN